MGEPSGHIRLLVTGGGTGGHLFPGIAVADHLLAAHPGSKVMFVGTTRLIDAQVLAGKDYEQAAIKAHGLKGKGWLDRLRAVAALPMSVLAALAIVRRFKPQVVLGVGGYVTGPVLVAARLLGVPTCIHEQNSIPGLANRMLGRVVRRVFLSIPGSERFFPAAKCVVTGNPVRRELLEQRGKNAAAIKGRLTLLVLGGSQGAHRLNELVPEVAALRLSMFKDRVEIIHQTGAADADWVRQRYQELGVGAEVAPFITEMASAYQQADLIVSRAGATTIAEMTALGKPAILVPYPFAADNHQDVNARYLADRGGAVLLAQQDLTAEVLGREIVRLLSDDAARQKMAGDAAGLARPAATEEIVANCLAMAGGN